MEYQVTLNFGKPFAIFPLPGTILMPHAVMPLHVFEPRYRRMTHDALDSNGLITMAMFEQKPREEDYLHGHPAVRPVVCPGYVERYEKLSDGRYLILLRGLCRAKIIEEVHGQPYRQAMLEPLDWPPAEDVLLAHEREAITEALNDANLDHHEAIDELRRVSEQPVPTVGLIDLIIAATAKHADQRYDMLCETDAGVRAAWVLHHLASLHRIASPSRRKPQPDQR